MDEVDFATLGYEEAQELKTTAPVWVEMNRRYLGATEDGDTEHWQEGLGEGVTSDEPAGYNGPLPDRNKDNNRSFYLSGLKRTFTSEDVLAEVAKRRQSGILGSEPHKGFGEDYEAENEAITEYCDERDTLSVWQDNIKAINYAGESFLRIRMAWERTEDGLAQPSATTTEEALQYLYVEQVDPDDAVYVRDGTTMQEGIIYYGEAPDEVETAEITYVDDDGLTVLRVAYADDREPEEVRVAMGGNMFFHRSQDDLFITSSMRDNQVSLNTTRTMIERSNHKAGFPVIIATNVDVEGNEVEAGPDTVMIFKSVPRHEVNEHGEEVENMGGPAVDVVPPAEIDGLVESCRIARESIYRGAKQLHVMMSGDATASGESRIQARSEYVTDLENLAAVANRAGRWTLSALYSLAEHLAGQAVDEERVAEFECKLDPGPVTSDMYTALLKALAQRAISLERFMVLTGVEDTEAEREKIKQDLEDLQTPRESAETRRVNSAIEREAAGDGLPANIERRRQQIEVAANGAA